ncbi:MAG: hypothetical protein JWQ09_5806 [Segetibacter sp.]|nr:hypothetical protein [Segetibacter sp.]
MTKNEIKITELETTIASNEWQIGFFYSMLMECKEYFHENGCVDNELMSKIDEIIKP